MRQVVQDLQNIFKDQAEVPGVGSVKEGDGAVGGPGDGGVGVVLQAPKHGTHDGGWVGETLQALHSQHGEAGRFSANNHKIRERN